MMFGQVKARDSTHARTWMVLADDDHHQIQLLQAEAEHRRVGIPIFSP
jgi:hypothetical protein